MVEYVKIGKEDFEIIDWVTEKENPNDFIMRFRVKGNVVAARNMVNQRLKGIIGKYSIQNEVVSHCTPLPEDLTVHNTAEAIMHNKVNTPNKPMPASTRDL